MKCRAVVLGVLLLTTVCYSQRRATVRSAGGPIPAGTQIQVRFIDNLTSTTARAGDTFRATLEQPIVVNGRTLYARGADITGKVISAHGSGRLSDPGVLELQLTSISAGGTSYPLNVAPLRIKGESHTKSNVTKIGGGAAAGAVIGAIAGGGKGAAIGAGVGAAAGTGVAAATGKKEAKIESEAVLAFTAAEPPQGTWPATSAAQRNGRGYNGAQSYNDPNYPAQTYAQGDGTRGFGPHDRQSIRNCFSGNTAGLPPGLAKRDRLPPGLERQVQRNGTLPPGLQKRVQPLPGVCSAGLPRLPADWVRVILGRRVLLLDPAQRIVDLFSLDQED